jgi:hypothetical protein
MIKSRSMWWVKCVGTYLETGKCIGATNYWQEDIGKHKHKYEIYGFVKKKTPWPESASEVYRPNDRRLSTNLVPTFAGRWCHVVSVTNPYGRILDFLDRSRYFFSSSSSVVLWRLSGPRSRPLLLKKSGSAVNRTRTSGSVVTNSDH